MPNGEGSGERAGAECEQICASIGQERQQAYCKTACKHITCDYSAEILENAREELFVILFQRAQLMSGGEALSG